MSLHLFAHDGEVHETEAEATAHAAQTAGITIPADALAGGAALLGLAIFWLVATYIFKWHLATKVLVIMAALLVIGVACYQFAPITSVVALATGFALSLGSMFMQLRSGQRHRS